MFIVDTDVMIDVQRGHPPALAWFASLTELPVIPGIVVMELIQDARNTQEVQRVLKLTAPLNIVWPSDADCNAALTLFTSYHLSHGLGLLDALIGAAAIGLGASLQTFNNKHFQIIPGLVLDQPYVR